MKMLIINTEIAEKLRNTDFGKWDKLDPIKGEFDGKEVYFLQAELYLRALYGLDRKFEKALADFEVCEIKDIESVETKYYDAEEKEITDVSKIDISTATCKTILIPKI
jgi:hypothetical protein